jgi:predicted dehydrogenase
MQHRIAIIGLGVMGQRMLSNMTAHDRFDVVGAWDLNPDSCAEARTAHPDLHIAEMPDEIIGDAETDVVYIACPPAAHRDYVLSAVAAGKAVFCEKPLGVDLAESRDLVAQVEQSGLANAVNFVYASATGVRAIEKELADGTLGDLAGVDLRLHFSKWPRAWQESATWLGLREQGGFIREVLSHFVYLSERLFGPAQLRNASLRFPPGGERAETHALVDFACGGLPVSVAASVGGAGPDRVEYTIWGSARSYRLYDWYWLSSSDGDTWTDELAKLEDPRQDAYMCQLDNTAALFDGGPHDMPDFRAALSVQEFIEKVLRTP